MTSLSANAALLSRLSGQAYYDDVLNITWLADANAGAGSIYDDGFSATDGQMSWTSAQSWIASLNAAGYLGVNDWRLPTIIDTGTSGCSSYAYTGTDCGYNVDPSTSEMAHLFYSTLGNEGWYDTSATPTDCNPLYPYCLTNDGPFSNLQSYPYWSGTTYAPDPSSAWYFRFDFGEQSYADKVLIHYNAWAVRSGDIGLAVIPIPAAFWLFTGALGALGWVRRSQAAA